MPCWGHQLDVCVHTYRKWTHAGVQQELQTLSNTGTLSLDVTPLLQQPRELSMQDNVTTTQLQ